MSPPRRYITTLSRVRFVRVRLKKKRNRERRLSPGAATPPFYLRASRTPGADARASPIAVEVVRTHARTRGRARHPYSSYSDRSGRNGEIFFPNVTALGLSVVDRSVLMRRFLVGRVDNVESPTRANARGNSYERLVINTLFLDWMIAAYYARVRS